MENQLIIPQDTPEYLEAVELTRRIKFNSDFAASAMVAICKDLKRMRDGRLYLALGLESFEDYAREVIGIEQRQAYTYITTYERLGDDVLQSNASLGITKLSLLAQAPAVDRADLLDNGELEGKSAREVKEMVEKLRVQGEQLSLLTDEKAEAERDAQTAEEERDAAIAREAALKEQLRAEAEPVDVEKLKKEAIAETEKKLKAQMKEAVDKAKQTAEKEAQAKIDAARNEGEKKGRTAAEQDLAPLAAEKKRAEERARELEKQLCVASNKDTVLIGHLFEELQGTFGKIVEIINRMEAEDAAKFRGAMRKYVDIMAGQVKDDG